MKRILLLIVIGLSSIFCFGQIIVGEYKNSMTDKKYKVEVETRNGEVSYLYVEIRAEQSNSCYIKLPSSKIPMFRTALEQMYHNLLFWGGEAIKNNVENLKKEMTDVKFPLVTILWKSGSEYRNCLNVRITPTFTKTKNACFVFFFWGNRK